ncbi:hypothetical protein VPH35_053011 [Triticum aestivum]|uniref:Uncharacterized protein n=1 Tax=Triticum aestivum TaxID=4565 RepID=A0A077RT27_WHEAT|nr:unnamed protein product [Triticum aestivum]
MVYSISSYEERKSCCRKGDGAIRCSSSASPEIAGIRSCVGIVTIRAGMSERCGQIMRIRLLYGTKQCDRWANSVGTDATESCGPFWAVDQDARENLSRRFPLRPHALTRAMQQIPDGFSKESRRHRRSPGAQLLCPTSWLGCEGGGMAVHRRLLVHVHEVEAAGYGFRE